MRALRFVVALIGSGLAALRAQTPAAPPAPTTAASSAIPYTTFTLPNGLRVIAAEDHTTPVVAVDIHYNVGSRDERPGRSGFAHLFEHMMFEGSAHAPKGLHSHLIEAAGGRDNASTAEDRTNYFATVPSNYLNVVLWLEADRMRSLAITDSTFHNQRETVKEERRLRVDNEPYGAAFTDALVWPFDSASCFGYAHTVIGSMADLDRAEVKDVHAFFDTYYAPNNAILVVSGDFKPLELRSLVNQYFAPIPRRPDPPKPVCDFKFSPGVIRRTITDAHANLPAVMRIYRIPPHRHPDTFAMGVLTVILGQGESSRLNVSVVRRDQVALATDVSMNPYDSRRGPGILVVFAIANRGATTARLDSLVGRQLDSLRTTEVSDSELTKAKNLFRARFIRSRQTALGRAQTLQHYFMFHGSLAEVNTDLDRYLAVTAADVKRVAATYLDPANMVQVVIQAGGGGAQ
jgi:predicted Zn-dependent peptidase